MKQEFRGYYQPTKSEFDRLWADAMYVVDANVLLNLYAYSDSTCDEILRLFEEHRERMWIPYQAAGEYHECRCKVIDDQVSRFKDVEAPLKQVSRALSAKKGHPFIGSSLFNEFEEVVGKIISELAKSKSSRRALLHEDPICERISAIFQNAVGERSTDEELSQIIKEGKTRYREKIPPGFEDRQKNESSAYGDLILWKQVIKEANRRQKHVILITDDSKCDWWQKSKNEQIGPHPLLLQEFFDCTGKQLYLYGTERFVEFAKARGEKVTENAVEELNDAAERRREKSMNDMLKIDEKTASLMREMTRETDRVAADMEAAFPPPRDKFEAALKSLDVQDFAQRRAMEEYLAARTLTSPTCYSSQSKLDISADLAEQIRLAYEKKMSDERTEP